MRYADVTVGQQVWVKVKEGGRIEEEAGTVTKINEWPHVTVTLPRPGRPGNVLNVQATAWDVTLITSNSSLQTSPVQPNNLADGASLADATNLRQVYNRGYGDGKLDGRQERDTEWATHLLPLLCDQEAVDTMDPSSVACYLKTLQDEWFGQAARVTALCDWVRNITNGVGGQIIDDDQMVLAKILFPDRVLEKGDTLNLGVGKMTVPAPITAIGRTKDLLEKYVMNPVGLTVQELDDLHDGLIDAGWTPEAADRIVPTCRKSTFNPTPPRSIQRAQAQRQAYSARFHILLQEWNTDPLGMDRHAVEELESLATLLGAEMKFDPVSRTTSATIPPF